MRRAIVLLSGGLDSTTVLAVAQAEGYELYALSFRYGQRHSIELEAAKKVAASFRVKKHLILNLDLQLVGGSALTDTAIDVPKNRSLDSAAKAEQNIPITYVPARNTIFLSYALAWAEVLGCADVFLGVNALDYSGYPDCRPAFIEAFERLASVATKAGVEGEMLRIHTPLIQLTKAQIVELGLRLGVDYSQTHSCYDPAPDGASCGRCDSCQLRLKGFAELGIEDPVEYQA